MSAIRTRIEKWFERLAHIIYRHRFTTVVLMLVLSGVVISQVPKITLDTSTEGFLRNDDPALLAYNEFRDQFGRDEVIIVAVESEVVFDPVFLKKLEALHIDLDENVPYIDDITSLINARDTRGEADELIVEDFLENWPRTLAEMETLENRARSNPLYKNLLLSEDGHFTTIVIRTHSHSGGSTGEDVLAEFDNTADQTDNATESESTSPGYLTDAENSEVVTAVRQVVKKHNAAGFDIYIAGSPAVSDFLKRSMISDMRKFMILALATIAVLLFVMFRRITGVFFPLLIVLLSLLSTVGIMAATGTSIKLPTQILPSFLLAVGVGTSVHILAIFYQRFDLGDSKEEAIAFALGHSGLAVVMTNVTTAVGLMSFATSELAPIADLGVFAGTGVLIAFINTIVLLPALLAIFPIRIRKTRGQGSGDSLMDRLLATVSSFSTSYPKPILIVSAVVICASIAAITKIGFSHHPLEWFPRDNPVRIATEKLDSELKGTLNLEVIIDTAEENGLYDPDLLNRLDEAAVFAEAQAYGEVFVGKAWSLTTILKEINQALNENRPDYYVIPEDKKLIAQEILLFENSGSDDLEDVVDSQFSKARFTIKGPFRDSIQYANLIDIVGNYFTQKFPEAEITLTGMMALLSQTINHAIRSMARSYLIALVVITVLMIILIGKFRIGLLSMVPNLTPILMTLAVIGVTPIKMDLFTMMVASIAIGLAVDDTIHFMHNFRRYYEQTGDPKLAVHKTLHTAGRAMLVTTIVLSSGFAIFAFATMNNLASFGMLTAFTVFMALVADYFLAPALMVLVNKPFTVKTEEHQ